MILLQVLAQSRWIDYCAWQPPRERQRAQVQVPHAAMQTARLVVVVLTLRVVQMIIAVMVIRQMQHVHRMEAAVLASPRRLRKIDDETTTTLIDTQIQRHAHLNLRATAGCSLLSKVDFTLRTRCDARALVVGEHRSERGMV